MGYKVGIVFGLWSVNWVLKSAIGIKNLVLGLASAILFRKKKNLEIRDYDSVYLYRFWKSGI